MSCDIKLLTLNIVCICANFWTIFFISDVFIGTIDFYHLYHFLWPWLRVTRPADSKALWLHSLRHFQLIRWNDNDVMFKQFKLNILVLLLSEIYWMRGSNCCFTDCIKNWMLSCIWTFIIHLFKCLQWLIMQERWLHVSFVNIEYLSIYGVFFVLFWVFFFFSS